MRKDITIEAEARPGRGKNEANRLRAKGMMPAVLYGAGKESVSVALNPKILTRILHSTTGHNTIFNLTMATGESTPAMIVDWLRDPVKENLLHVDLLRIDLSKRIKVKVPVHFKGDPKGVKQQGGIFEVVMREVEVECLPDDIPEFFDVDVSDLELNKNVRAGDLPMTGSMKLLADGEALVAHVVALKAEVAAAEEAVEGVVVAAGTEPEVVKKGKKDEAAPEAAGDKKAGDKKAGGDKKKK